MGRWDNMRIEEEKEEEKIMLLGGWEEGSKGFFDAAASLDEKGGFVYGTTCWH